MLDGNVILSSFFQSLQPFVTSNIAYYNILKGEFFSRSCIEIPAVFNRAMVEQRWNTFIRLSNWSLWLCFQLGVPKYNSYIATCPNIQSNRYELFMHAVIGRRKYSTCFIIHSLCTRWSVKDHMSYDAKPDLHIHRLVSDYSKCNKGGLNQVKLRDQYFSDKVRGFGKRMQHTCFRKKSPITRLLFKYVPLVL